MQEDAFAMEPGLNFIEKVRVVAACGVAILLLWTLGWQLAQPADPQMAVTLSRNGASVLAVWPALAVLAAISAAVGTAIIGRRLPEAGVLAAAVGLAVMSLRGGTMEALLGYEAGTETATRKSLMMSLAIDCVLWTGIMAVAWIAMAIVRKWLWADVVEMAPQPVPVPVRPAASGAGKNAPSSKSAAAAPAQKSQSLGYITLAITIVIGIIVIWNSIARTPVAMVEQHQVIASVAGGLFLGAMAGRYFTGVTEPLWYVLAAPIVALAGYILGYLSSDMSWTQGTIFQPYALLATTPPHDLARPLPILYITVGVAGALGGFWTADRMEKMAQQEAA